MDATQAVLGRVLGVAVDTVDAADLVGASTDQDRVVGAEATACLIGARGLTFATSAPRDDLAPFVGDTNQAVILVEMASAGMMQPPQIVAGVLATSEGFAGLSTAFAPDSFGDEMIGKVVVMDFWASWCKPCRKSFPWMNQLLTRYPADKFTVITVNLDAETESMHDFLEKVPARFDVYHDPSGSIAEKFQLEGMPTSYLIDRNGKVVKKHIGFLEKDIEKYESEIEALL